MRTCLFAAGLPRRLTLATLGPIALLLHFLVPPQLFGAIAEVAQHLRGISWVVALVFYSFFSFGGYIAFAAGLLSGLKEGVATVLLVAATCSVAMMLVLPILPTWSETYTGPGIIAPAFFVGFVFFGLMGWLLAWLCRRITARAEGS